MAARGNDNNNNNMSAYPNINGLMISDTINENHDALLGAPCAPPPDDCYVCGRAVDPSRAVTTTCHVCHSEFHPNCLSLREAAPRSTLGGKSGGAYSE